MSLTQGLLVGKLALGLASLQVALLNVQASIVMLQATIRLQMASPVQASWCLATDKIFAHFKKALHQGLKYHVHLHGLGWSKIDELQHLTSAQVVVLQ